MATLTASGGNTYSWSNGALTPSITGSPATTTTYTVYVTAGSCSAIATATITVNSSITAGITGNTILCAGSSTTLTATGGSVFSWSTGATSPALVITPSSSSTYSVWVSSGTCKDSTSITVNVNPNPVAAASSATICAGTSGVITASGGNSYSWSNSSTSPSITVSPTTTTIYSVTVTGAGGCTDVTTATVTVNQAPTASISGNISLCVGDNTILTASGGGTYSWNTGATSATINVTPPSSTHYTVTVTNAGGCTNTAVVAVTVSPPPVANISGNNTLCAGSSTVLTATGGGLYAWDTGPTTAAITVTPATTTNYSVIVSIGSCADTAYYTVTVNPVPTANISGINQLCKGTSTTLTATGGGTYLWNTGSASSSITVSPSSTGSTTYTVTVTNAGGCTAAAVVTVTVYPQPTAIIAGPASICSGSSVVLTATGGGNYLWSTSEITSSISITPTATSNYSVLVSIGTCTAVASYTVTVLPTPVATAQSSVVINIGDNTTLTATGGGSYSWVPSTGLSCTNCSDPVASPEQTTDYCVYVKNATCVDSACVTVTVDYNCKPVYIPNAFSPNGDGDNDILYVVGNCIKDMKLVIYNRWGQKVYEGTDPKEGWDGIYKGKPEDTAVFDYYLTYKLITGTEGSKKGNVSLVR
jgi:gliding motility-associated-like protein